LPLKLVGDIPRQLIGDAVHLIVSNVGEDMAQIRALVHFELERRLMLNWLRVISAN